MGYNVGMKDGIAVYLEVVPRRAYVSALDWPGWSRGGSTEQDALDTLIAYAPRYAAVAEGASIAFRPPKDAAKLEVVERIPGGASTEFGIPSLPASGDERPIDEKELERLRALLRASWASLDAASAAARGVPLRKGPRGGGRDLDKIVQHVFQAEQSYLHQLGVKRPRATDAEAGDSAYVAAEMPGLREAILEALLVRGRDEPLPEPSRVKKPWSARYFLRRAAWHVLDHAWEIEDRVAAE